MRINHIEANSYVDGPGRRTVVFFQGCPLACPGCQSKHTWDPAGGYETTPAELAETLALLAGFAGNITISGGDPFAQPEALAELVHRLRPNVGEILVYTGYTWEELLDPNHPAGPWMKSILENVGVLVDGRFVRELDDATITYRGSRNQRPIDVRESLSTGAVVVLDWDNEIVLLPDGDLILPAGFAGLFTDLGRAERSRRCGQSV